nr:nucleotidyltransferase family protein [Zhihengliuella flava]
MDEAVPLAAALVSRVAEDHAVRALILKGPPATELGIRSQRPSSDVDLLVERDSLPVMVEALSQRGWRRRPTTHDGEHPLHSVTMYHPQWPSDIDVHYAYPGLESQDSSVFEALWERRRSTTLGARAVWALDPTATYLIQALHALREHNKPINISERRFLISEAPRPDWEDLRDLAQRTGSLGPLRAFAREAYPNADRGTFPAPSLEWLRRTEVTEPGVFRLLHLHSLPWARRPKYVLQGLFPSREQLAATDLRLLDAPARTLALARLRRIARFAMRLPSAGRQWMEQRRQR